MSTTGFALPTTELSSEDVQDVVVRVKPVEDTFETNDLDDKSSLENVTVKKVPHKKSQGSKSIIFKFMLAMLWVVISSAIIFLVLLGYKKIVIKKQVVIEKSKEKSLESPKTFKEAVNLFLDITKWE